MSIQIILSNKPQVLLGCFNEKGISDIIFSYVGIWEFFSEFYPFTICELEKYKNKIDWNYYIKNTDKITIEISKKFHSYINWYLVIKNWMYNAPIDMTKVHILNSARNSIHMHELRYDEIKKWLYSIDFIDCFPYDVDWKYAIMNKELPDYIILRYLDIISSRDLIDALCIHQNVSDIKTLIVIDDVFGDCELWKLITKYQNLTRKHYILFMDNLDWEYILTNYSVDIDILNSLPLMLIHRHIQLIVKNQQLDDDFIFKYLKIIDISTLMKTDKCNKIYKNCGTGQFIYMSDDGRWISNFE